METADKKLYEGMFLVDSAKATDWDAVTATIKTILERAGAEIVSIRKWDDRKLAYEINGKTRGTYILCYFRADGGRIRDIEKAVQLSERIMRVLILSSETIGESDIQESAPAMPVEQERQDDAEKAEKVEVKEVDVQDQPEQGSALEQAMEPAEQIESASEMEVRAGESEQPEQVKVEETLPPEEKTGG